MMTDQARVSLVAQGTEAIACEVCTSETNIPNATVVVQHPRGGAVHLAACDWCVQAMRRLSAATGGRAVFALADGAIPVPAHPRQIPPAPRPPAPPILLFEFPARLRH